MRDERVEEGARIDPDDMTPPKTLAKRASEMGKHADAEKYARMALEIDVTDRECQRILVDALAALNRAEEAERLRRIFGL